MYINYSTPSGLKTTSAQISSRPGSLNGVDVQCPTTGYNIVTIYDSSTSDTSGKIVLAVVEADAGMVGINHEFFVPVAVNQGIYVSVTGTGTDYSYNVRYGL